MTKPISQREARRLRKRVEELEHAENCRRSAYARDYPGGVNIGSVKWEGNDPTPVKIHTARLLKHAVVVTADSDGTVRFYALPLAGTR